MLYTDPVVIITTAIGILTIPVQVVWYNAQMRDLESENKEYINRTWLSNIARYVPFIGLLQCLRNAKGDQYPDY